MSEVEGAVADVAADPAIVAGGDDLVSHGNDDLAILNEPDAVEGDAKAEGDGAAAKTDEKFDADKVAAKDGEAEKTDEAKTEEQKKADELKADADKKAEADKGEPRAVASLRRAIDADPAAKAALEANPALSAKLFANAKRAERLFQFQEHIKTPELAKMAKEASEDLTGIETDYSSGKPEGYDAILDRLFKASVERDAQGNFVKEKDGSYKSTGKYEGFLRHYRTEHFWPGFEQLLNDPMGKQLLEQRELEADDVSHAVTVLKKFLGDPDKGAPAAKPASEQGKDKYANYSPEDRAKLEEFDRLKLQEANTGQQAEKKYATEVRTEVETSVKGFLQKRVEKMAPALTEKLRQKVVDDAFREINGIAKKDPLYGKQRDSLYRDRTPEGRKKFGSQALEYAQEIAGPICQRLVKEYGEPAVKASTERVAKIEQQSKRAEPKSAGGVSQPATQDEDALIREGDKLKRQLYGRGLTDREILDIDEVMPKLQKESQSRKRA